MIGALVTALAAVAVIPAGASAAPQASTTEYAIQATGWTAIPSDYATNRNTPAFSACRVTQTPDTITLKVRAKRPNNVAVSISVSWNSRRDSTGVGGNAYADDWGPSGYATVRFTMPKSSYQGFSWQSATVGYGYTAAKRPPLDTLSCP
ncbi:hypothetical protein [Saccharothrix texasensis]|uniref:hypothetical protein n=1 Tax=Saccharothrix texasensis TaxID=103734 RepID=UPI000F4D2AE1|nr:hypothetical protein [Saccharothrix texasensis]